jgi:hypothetical protein
MASNKRQRRFKHMSNFNRAAEFSTHRLAQQVLVFLLSLGLLFAACPLNVAASPAPQDQAQAQAPPDQAQAPPYTTQTPDQLQRLVAPIAFPSKWSRLTAGSKRILI